MIQFIRNFLTMMSYAMGAAFGWKLMNAIWNHWFEALYKWLSTTHVG